MKKIVIAISSLMFLCCWGFAGAELKIGILDLNKVMQNSPQVTAAQAELKKQFEPRSKDLTAKQEAFQAEVSKFNSQGSGPNKLNDADMQQLKQKILADQKSLQDLAGGFQKDFLTQQDQTMRVVLNKIQDVVNQVAKAKKLNLVITKISTAYNDANLEITDDVIASLKK